MLKDMAATMRRVGQSMVKQPTPRRLVANPSPTVRKIEGQLEVERVFVDPMSRSPIALIPVRIGGVTGLERPGAIDSGADVNVMAMNTMAAAKLEHKFKAGNPRFTQADSKESVAKGWVDTFIGLGNNFELGARFIVEENIDYDLLLGTTSMKRINRVINFAKDRFEFQLPRCKQGRALPLTCPRSIGQTPHVSVANAARRLVRAVPDQLLSGPHVENVFGAMELQPQSYPEGPAAPPEAFPAARVCQEEDDLDDEDEPPPLVQGDSDNEDEPPSLIEGDSDDEEEPPPLVQDDSDDEDDCDSKLGDPDYLRTAKLGAGKMMLAEEAVQLEGSDAEYERLTSTCHFTKTTDAPAPAPPLQAPHLQPLDDDYAFGFIFRLVKEARQYFNHLVLNGLLTEEKATKQIGRYDHLLKHPENDELLHPVRTSHLPHVPKHLRLKLQKFLLRKPRQFSNLLSTSRLRHLPPVPTRCAMLLTSARWRPNRFLVSLMQSSGRP
jgi:hypothetical protein